MADADESDGAGFAEPERRLLPAEAVWASMMKRRDIRHAEAAGDDAAVRRLLYGGDGRSAAEIEATALLAGVGMEDAAEAEELDASDGGSGYGSGGADSGDDGFDFYL